MDLFALSNVIESALRWDNDYPQQNNSEEFSSAERLEYFLNLSDKWEAMADVCRSMVNLEEEHVLEDIINVCKDAAQDFRRQGAEIK